MSDAGERRQPPGPESVPCVLAIDDDELSLAMIRAVLERHGCRVISLDDPLQFARTLEAHPVDIVVVDYNMPDLDGPSLCRLLRSDARYGALPVLVLTAHDSPEMVRSIYEAGADDYVSKSMLVDVLPRRVELLVKARRGHHQM
jgi:DNA-binding response OmpR family regulator